MILAVNFPKLDCLGSNGINGLFVGELLAHVFCCIIVSVNNTIEEVGLLEWVRDIKVQLGQISDLVFKIH